MLSFFRAFILVFCFALASNNFFVFASEITFFDVGQGNCTLVKFNDPKKPSETLAPLLVDAGNTSGRSSFFNYSDSAEGKEFEKNRDQEVIDRIVEKTKDILDSTSVKNEYLNVVVSHGDKDHHSLIPDVIEMLLKKYPKLKVNYFLGGVQDDYPKAPKPKATTKKKKAKKQIGDLISKAAFADFSLAPGDSIDKYNNTAYEFVVLSALREIDANGISKDKNANSLVLYIKNKTTNKSLILTGDATGTTTSSILTAFPLLKDATILQAAHHGAATDGSNNTEWLQAVNPEFIILSTGVHDGYMHPRQTMLRNALNITGPRLRYDMLPHLLYYYSDWSFIDSCNFQGLENHHAIGRVSNDYLCALTTLGIYSSTSQGDMTFNFKDNEFFFDKNICGAGGSTPFPPAPPLPAPIAFPPEILFEAMSNFLNQTDRNETTSISFPTLQFSDLASGGVTPTTKDFEKLIDLIIVSGDGVFTPINSLVSCDLSKVSFADSAYIDAPLGIGPGGSAFHSQVTRIIGDKAKAIPGIKNFRELSLPPMHGSQKDEFKSTWEAMFGYQKKGLKMVEHLF